MRLPIHVPGAADDGRRPVRLRLATLGVAAALAAATALAVPNAASADDLAPVGDPAAASAVPDEPTEPAEPPVEEPAVPVEPAAELPDGAAETEAAPQEPATPEPGDAQEPEPAESTDIAAFAERTAAEYDVASAASGSHALAPAEAGLANQPPVAMDDHYVTTQDTPLVVDDPGLRANDHDPEGGWHGIDDVLPASPELSWSHDGDFVYTPPSGFVGTRSFTYQLRDLEGLLSDPATITIEVLPAGSMADLPPIANDDHYLWAMNAPLFIAAPGVLANDEDPGADASDLALSMLIPPLEGSVALHADGSFLFTPEPDRIGTYWFTYRACDATTCADALVWLDPVELGGVPSGPSVPPVGGQPVDLPPVAVPDTLDAVAGELAALAAPGVLGNDSDPEAQPLELVGLSQPANGVIYHWQPDGTVQYVPNDGFAGADQVTYTVSDGAHTATSTLTFTVTEPANYAPQAWEDEVSMLAGTTLVVDAPGVLGNDSDQDGDALAVTWVGAPQDGTIALQADGSFSYTPDAGFTGTDVVGYEVSDGSDAATSTLVIHVIPADAPAQPSVVGDHYTAMTGALLLVPAPGVLGNDLAPSGPVSVIAVEPAQHGTVEIDPDGGLRYTSDPGYTGADTMRYTISDGEEQADGLISITVLGPTGGCATEGDLAGTRLGPLPAVAAPWEPAPDEPCGEEAGQPGGSDEPTSSAGEPGGDASGPAPAPEPGREEAAASTGAQALARTGAELGAAAALAILLTALGIALRLRRRPAEH